MANVAQSADPVCPWREAAGRRQRHKRNPDPERYTVAPVANRKPQSVDARSNGRSGARSPPATEARAENAAKSESIQQPKRDRRDYEQVHRGDAVGMIAQKSLPALRRWLPSPRHVFCHGGLPDIDAKLEQFAVDPRCSPKRVRDAHVANELANVRGGLST